ncbi:lipoprotein [Comamonadaceae bacterium G21597-S1]|nr:lipoprotein [Comamonadaceae bacterium G21597-S1]
MLRICQILVRVLALAASAVVLVACGQKGSLFIPTEPAAAQRATLPQTLRPGTPATAVQPVLPSSSPTSTP